MYYKIIGNVWIHSCIDDLQYEFNNVFAAELWQNLHENYVVVIGIF